MDQVRFQTKFGNLTRQYFKLAVLFVALLWHPGSYGQKLVLDKALAVGFNGSWGQVNGPKQTAENGYFTPSLFPSYSQLTGTSIYANYTFCKFMSAGLAFRSLNLSDWRYDGTAQTYEGSTSTIKSIGPTLRAILPYSRIGFRNRIQPFVEIYQLNSSVTTTLDFLPFGEKESFEDVTSTAYNIGLGAGAGIEVALTNQLGFMLNYSVCKHQFKSKLYDDSSAVFTRTDLGLFYRGLLRKKLF